MALEEELIEFNSFGLNFITTVTLTSLMMTYLQFEAFYFSENQNSSFVMFVWNLTDTAVSWQHH